VPRQDARGKGRWTVNEVRVVHVLRSTKPVCPKCGSKHEDEGGAVTPRGSWDEGPLWWECEDCGEEWGHA
jgi:transposase-like protein